MGEDPEKRRERNFDLITFRNAHSPTSRYHRFALTDFVIAASLVWELIPAKPVDEPAMGGRLK